MDNDAAEVPIDWEALKAKLPTGDHTLLDNLKSAHELRPHDGARVSQKVIDDDLAALRARFDELRS